MLAYDLHGALYGQVARDRCPGLAVVGALQHVRLEVVAPVPVERRVGRSLVMLRERRPAHVCRLRTRRELLCAGPGLASVSRNRDDAVITSRREQSGAER